MGIHGNSTCVMNYDGATGWLVGEPEKGLAAMFIMMNAARLGVGLQGLAQGEVAYQNAVAYAKERRQGRALKPEDRDPNAKADTLFVHPDVRRMLMDAKAFTEGGARADAVGRASGRPSRKAQTEEERLAADDLISLLTPVIKGYLTDRGFETAVNASRCSAGTAISANGAWSSSSATPASPRSTKAPTASRRWTWSAASWPRTAAGRCGPSSRWSAANRRGEGRGRPAGIAEPLEKAIGELQAATMWLVQNGMANPNNAGAGAYAYMQMMGIVSLGWMWLRWPACRRGSRTTPARRPSTKPKSPPRAISPSGTGCGRRAAPQGRGRRRKPDGAAGRGVLRASWPCCRAHTRAWSIVHRWLGRLGRQPARSNCSVNLTPNLPAWAQRTMPTTGPTPTMSMAMLWPGLTDWRIRPAPPWRKCCAGGFRSSGR